MVSATWPSTLPQDFRADGFSDSLENGLIKDEMNVGPPIYRRRSSAAPQPFSGSMTMTSAEWAELDTFFNDTLNGGTLRFVLPAQGTTNDLDLWTARFTTPPQRQSLDAEDLWLVTLRMERLIGTGQASTGTALFRDPDIFFRPTVIADQLLRPSRVSLTNTFYAPTISLRRLSPGLVTDADTFYAATVKYNQTLTAALYTDADTVYAADVLRTPAAGLFTLTNIFYTPSIAGPRSFSASLVTNTNTFYTPTVS